MLFGLVGELPCGDVELPGSRLVLDNVTARDLVHGFRVQQPLFKDQLAKVGDLGNRSTGSVLVLKCPDHMLSDNNERDPW